MDGLAGFWMFSKMAATGVQALRSAVLREVSWSKRTANRSIIRQNHGLVVPVVSSDVSQGPDALQKRGDKSLMSIGEFDTYAPDTHLFPYLSLCMHGANGQYRHRPGVHYGSARARRWSH
jgi:hypothetical protein